MRRIRLNRAGACLLSLFMPILVAVPTAALVVPLLMKLRPSENVVAFVLLAAVSLAIALRVHFAAWYARDKNRSGSWGLLGIFGLLGWLVLWSLEDRGFRFIR